MGVRFLCAVLIFILLECVCALKMGDPNVCAITRKSGSTKCRGRNCQNNAIPKQVVDLRCCKGYLYDSANNICKPNCVQGCVDGTCVKPGVCECSPPLILKNNNACVEPKCSTPCVNAQCIDDDVCDCNEGYLIYNATHCAISCPNGFINDPQTLECQPKCEKSCENGYCSGPNLCSCNEGYIAQDNTTCVPYCTKPCVNGKCIAPNICECNDGYRKDISDESKCLPVCENQCVNATCVEPNRCACSLGFEFVNPWTCRPKCDSCDYGTCVSPNQCECLEGYLRTENICKPICSEPCSNGFCSAPNTCECNNGYELNGGGVCQPICKDTCINGNCTAPDTCTCDSEYKMFNGSCIIPEDCSECNGTCNGEECKCENERPCYYQLKDESAEAATATSLAGLQLTWLMGGCAGILLVTLVIFVIGYIWKKRREYGVKPTEDAGYGNISVLTTMPDTLIHRRFSDNNKDVIVEEVTDEMDEEDSNKKFLTNTHEAEF